jgi:DNA-binding GntR family transcriptional regulator
LILLMGTLNHIFELHISARAVATALNKTPATTNRAALDMSKRLLDCIEARDGDGAEAIAREFLTRLDKQLRKAHYITQISHVLK